MKLAPPGALAQVDYVKGFGKLGGPNTVNVDLTEGGKQSLETKNILIATGSEVTPLPPVPVDNAQGKIVDSTGALDLKEVNFGRFEDVQSQPYHPRYGRDLFGIHSIRIQLVASVFYSSAKKELPATGDFGSL